MNPALHTAIAELLHADRMAAEADRRRMGLSDAKSLIQAAVVCSDAYTLVYRAEKAVLAAVRGTG